MPEQRLIDANAFRESMKERYRKTEKLIKKGEKHLDHLAEGFTEVDELLSAAPTVDAMVLPCNVGDTVFAINKNSKRVIPCDVVEIQIWRSGEPRISVFYESDDICSDDRECTGCPFSSWHQSPQECDYSCDGEYGGYDFKIEDFGKIVFLTPEAAEAALAEREENK